MTTEKAREAGVEDDVSSVASSFVSVRRASPTASISTTALDHEEASEQPPPYSSVLLNQANASPWTHQDPRTTSTESLVATAPPEDSRRRLLLIYIHGFMGNETSFQSFPAHVHNLISVLLADSHIVHTKIYPRYRTKKALEFAAHDFSKWLVPNLDVNTDVVLLGHSLGGLLAADVALLRDPRTDHLKHRLLGTISFDSPFLGMHPGVVWSGISSMFRPAPTPPKSPQLGDITQTDILTQASSSDPYFNPSFNNDVRLPVRTGWANSLHFVNKHSKHLTQATWQLMTCHVEFGSALADGKALKQRYRMIKALDNEDANERMQAVDGRSIPHRTRFVNYYTACHGRPKKPKGPSRHTSQDTAQTQSRQDSAVSSENAWTRTESLASQGAQSQSSKRSGQRSRDLDASSISSVSTGTLDTPELLSLQNPAGWSVDDSTRASPHLRPSNSLSSVPCGHSAAPSYTTLPSYSTQPPYLSPKLTTPLSPRASASTSHATLSPQRTDSSTPSMSASQPEEPIQTPVPPGPPPVPSDYPKDPVAYAIALKAYLQTSKDYAHALKRYHKSQVRQRKDGIYAKIQQKHATRAVDQEERRIELLLREEENKRIVEAPTAEARELEIEAARERRQRESELHRDQLKARKADEKEREKLEKETAKAERKAARQSIKEDRKTMRKAVKEQHKTAKEACKASRKAQGKPTCPSEVFGVSGSDPQDSERYEDDAADMRTTSDSSMLTREGTFDSRAGDSKSITKVTCSEKKQKDKKFCLLPGKDANGNRDAAWQRVFVKDVDEVGAHCGLFFPHGSTGAEASDDEGWGERYAGLVADVAERIEAWAQDALTERLAGRIQAL